jgi:hypothetical protein
LDIYKIIRKAFKTLPKGHIVDLASREALR